MWKDKINFQMESSMKGDNAQLIESSSFNNSNLIKKNEPQENENSKRVISSINDNQKNSIKLDDKDKILSNFSHAISNSKIPFYVLFPNVKKNLQNQTIPAEDLKRAFSESFRENGRSPYFGLCRENAPDLQPSTCRYISYRTRFPVSSCPHRQMLLQSRA